MSNTSPRLSSLGRLNIFGESTFASDASANGVYIRSLPVDISSLTVESIRNDFLRSTDTETARILGAFGGTVTTSHYVHGYSSTIPTSAHRLYDATDSGNATGWDILAAIQGSAIGNFTGGGFVTGAAASVSASGSPTDSIHVADAGGGLGSFTEGCPIAWATGNSGLPYYVGWLKSIAEGGDPDTSPLLQTTPPYDPQGTTCWGGAPTLWIPTTGELDPYAANGSNGGVENGAGGSLTSPATSFTLEILGHSSDQAVTILGASPIGLTYSFPVGQLPVMEITWGVAEWTNDGSGGEPAAGSWSFPAPEAGLVTYCAWGATAATSLPIMDLSIDIGITRSSFADGSKGGGVGGWFTSKRTPTITFQCLRQSSNELDAFEDQSTAPFTFQHGSQPGRLFALAAPAARVVEFPAPGDADGASTSSITLECHEYTGDAGSGVENEPIDSALRLAYI